MSRERSLTERNSETLRSQAADSLTPKWRASLEMLRCPEIGFACRSHECEQLEHPTDRVRVKHTLVYINLKSGARLETLRMLM